MPCMLHFSLNVRCFFFDNHMCFKDSSSQTQAVRSVVLLDRRAVRKASLSLSLSLSLFLECCTARKKRPFTREQCISLPL